MLWVFTLVFSKLDLQDMVYYVLEWPVFFGHLIAEILLQISPISELFQNVFAEL